MFRKCCKLYPLSETHYHISIMKALISPTEQKPDCFTQFILSIGFPGGRVVKNLPANMRDPRDAGWIPGSGRSPREGNGNPLQYSCLENSVDILAWKIPWTEDPGGL